MDNTLEYILNITGNMEEKLRSINIVNEQQLDVWAAVQQQVNAATATMENMGNSIGSMQQRISALQAQKQWIPADNIEAIRATNHEIEDLEREITRLNNLNGGRLSSWFKELKAQVPMLGALTNPLVLAAGAFQKLNAYIGESKAAYMEESVEVAKLGQVMRNTMGATQEQIDGILELAGAQQKLGVIGDETQIAGAQELATYLDKADSLKKLLPAMNDMLAQQYGLNATQEQAAQIGSMLGKVMEGQTGALSRYGYSFTKAQEKILKTGTEAERAAVLFDVVNSAVGGVNKALAETPEGKLKNMANNMGDLQERVGAMVVKVESAFAPVIAKIGEMMDDIISFFETNMEAITAVVGGVAAAIGFAFDVVWTPISLVFDLFSGFFAMLQEGNSFAWLLADALGAVAIGLAANWLWSKKLVIQNKLLALWSGLLAIKNAILTGSIWAQNAAWYANPIGLVVAAIAAVIGMIVLAVKHFDEWGAALLALMGPIGWIVNIVMSLKKHWDSIVSAFSEGGIVAGLKRIGLVLLDAILYPVQQLLELLAKIPGLGHLAESGANKILDMRKNLGLDKADKVAGTGVNDELLAAAGGTDKPKEEQPGAASNDAIATGGTRNTTVNITMNKEFIGQMNFNGGLQENSREVEREIVSIVYRILGIAETAS